MNQIKSINFIKGSKPMSNKESVQFIFIFTFVLNGFICYFQIKFWPISFLLKFDIYFF